MMRGSQPAPGRQSIGGFDAGTGSSSRSPQALVQFAEPYPPSAHPHSLPQQPPPSPEPQPRHRLAASSFMHEGPTQASSSTVTENIGDYNKTAVGSTFQRNCIVLHVQVPDPGSSSFPHAETIPYPTQTPALSDSQVHPVHPASTPAPTSFPQAEEASTRQRCNSTAGQRYATLLSAEGLGYPLWKPSPRRTDTGEEYTISIGDVGICSDMYPFHTLFNITKPRGGIPDEDEEPKGVEPPCIIQGKVTVDRSYHQNWKLLTRPSGSISEPEGSDLRTFNLKLSAKEGALLMLPQGGVLKRLQKTSMFKRRILDFWRDWYEFAEEEGDLDENQTLCLLTGVEQCRTWAMAVWDPVSGDSVDLGSLVLAADEYNNTYTWARPPPRCSTQSLTPVPTPVETDNELELKETVFIHAFWISRSNGTFAAHPSPVPGPGREGNGNHDEDPSRPRRNSRNPFDHSQGPPRPSQNPFRTRRSNDGSSSNSFPRTQPLSSGHNDSGQPEDWNTLRVESPDQSLSNTLSIVVLPDSFSTVSHPCRFINELALKLASSVRPSMLDSGCVAFSHDEDWINVLTDYNEPELPKGEEFLKLICEKFKFVAEGDAIYTENMTPAELDLRQQSLAFARGEAGLIPVLFYLREPDISYKGSQASMEEAFAYISDESTRGSLGGNYRSQNHASNHDECDFIPRPSLPVTPHVAIGSLLLPTPFPSLPSFASTPTPPALPSYVSTLSSRSLSHQRPDIVYNDLPPIQTKSSVSDFMRVDTPSAQLQQHVQASSDASPSKLAGKKRARTDSPDAEGALDSGQSSPGWRRRRKTLLHSMVHVLNAKHDMDEPSPPPISARMNDPKDYANTRAASVLPTYNALPHTPKKRRVALSGAPASDMDFRVSPDQSIFTSSSPVAIDSRTSRHDNHPEVEQARTTTSVKQEQHKGSVTGPSTPAVGTFDSTSTPTMSSTRSWRQRSYGGPANRPKAISPIAFPRRTTQHGGKKEEPADHVSSIASTSHSPSIPTGVIHAGSIALHNIRYKEEKSTFLSPFETFYDAFTDSKQLKTQLSDRLHWSDAPVNSHTQQHEKISEVVDPQIGKNFGSIWNEVSSPQHHGKSAFLAPPETFHDALTESMQLITQLSYQLRWSNTLVRSHDQTHEKLSEAVDALLEEKVGDMRNEVLSLRHRMEELEYALHATNPRLSPVTEEAHGQP
ncbi:hypothetical protein PQX77_015680 [Marasmius sp. AFHP31]|nr:hypothetical protein PQX77_015680 [Marasmius sp. AFHP31]